jgi:phosphoglycolate phosphatase
MRISVDTILFDLDGTLIEPGIDFGRLNARVLQVCSEAGLDTEAWTDLPALELIDNAVAELRSTDADRAANLAITAARAIMDVEIEAATRVRPYPGVQSFLQALGQAGHKVGIVTRNCRRAADIVLQRFPLSFDILLTRDEALYVKPNPRHLLQALQAMGASAAAVLMCGDHPMDITAGKAIGAYTAAVRTDTIDLERLLQAGPDIVLERVTDLAVHLDSRLVRRGMQVGQRERG